MESPPDFEALVVVAFFVVPGYIGVGCFDHFVLRQRRANVRLILECLAVSLLFWVLVAPFVGDAIAARAFEREPFWSIVKLSAAALLIPAVGGLIIGKLVEDGDKRWLRLVAPRAWDFRFAKQEPLLVLVTLDDGSRIGGVWAARSCAAVYPEAEDLYLETLFELDDEGRFKRSIDGSLGAWIPGTSIRRLEFMEVRTNEQAED